MKRESHNKLLPGEQVLRDATGFIIQLSGPFENNGGETARGFDFGLAYELQSRSRLDWSWYGFDLDTTVSYNDGFHEVINTGPQFPDGKKEHWAKQTWMFDGQASYHFKSALELLSGSCWRRALNDLTLRFGCNNILGQDPPRVVFTLPVTRISFTDPVAICQLL